eukprot:2709455-Amphidinium_carterae.3
MGNVKKGMLVNPGTQNSKRDSNVGGGATQSISIADGAGHHHPRSDCRKWLAGDALEAKPRNEVMGGGVLEVS